MVGTFTLRGISVDLAYSIALFVETLVHGIYTSLFIAAMSVMLKRHQRKSSRNSSMSWIFPVSMIIMYLISSFHTVLGFYRFLRAYVLQPPAGYMFFWEFRNWDTFVNNLLVCLIIWVGDILVIYRCYCVWNNNLILIIVPLLLLAASIGINVYTMIWFDNPLRFSVQSEIMSLNAIYPVSLAQNVITTGLITLKIWNQHRNSTASGVIDRSSRLSLLKIVRIIIESAMIYTGQLFILVILYFANNTFQYVVQNAIVPSLGIVFVLIALRVHNAKQLDAQIGTSVGFIPSAWLRDGDRALKSHNKTAAPSTASHSEFPKSKAMVTLMRQTFGSPTYPPHKTLPIAHQASDLQ
ncbi:hypothetical protein BJ912DRAFT_905397 [Pholiota molesta]|nr:hypothetical protein BJ912DRAFT_905397 [Pholiota molesta]